MGNYDGKVVISTKLDTNPIYKGVKAVKGALGGLATVAKNVGAAIGIAFSAIALFGFLRDSVTAANELSDALTGLKSILDGQGKSFSSAQKFIESYTEDGLIPATNAITAYKNLAARGYDNSQIQQVMVALKDASAFGRQASYTMGEAVQSATEGLKNENSILVDNAGVTKNVAKMWEEYAASIGTTAGNLTQQQKIQAEVTGILEETKYQTGDAAKVASTLNGQLQQLSFRFNDLKVAVGNAVSPFVQSFIPVVTAAVAALSRFANAIATVVGILFGKAKIQTGALAAENDAVASSASAGAAAEEELAGATSAAGKAAKKSLASFDELNKLQAQSGGGGASSGAGAAGSSGGSTTAEADIEDTVSPKLQAIADKIRQLIAPLREIDFTPAIEAFGRLKSAVEPITSKLFEGLEWAWFKILVPLAAWTIEDALPAFLDLLSAALKLLDTVIDGLKPLGIWLWEGFLQPLAEWTGGAFIDAMGEITDLLHDLADLISGEISFGDFISNLSTVQTLLLGIAAAFGTIKVLSAGKAALSGLKGIAKSLKGFAKSIRDMNAVGLIGKIAETFSLAFAGTGPLIEKIGNLGEAFRLVFGPGSIIAGIASVIGGIVLAVTNFITMLQGGFNWVKEALMVLGIAIAAVGAIILGAPAVVAGVIAAIVAAVATIVVVVKEHWNEICAFFAVAVEWFDVNVIQPIALFFSGLWTGISTAASNCWSAIVEFFTPAIEWFSALFGSVWQTISDIFYNIGVIAGGCWEIIKAVWGVASQWFNEHIIQPVSKFFSNMWNGFVEKAKAAWNGVKSVFSTVAGFFGSIFSEAWKKVVSVFSTAGEIFTNIKDGILTAFKSIVNGIIKGLNKAIALPFNGINSALRKIRDINIMGLTPFSGLSTINVPQIPLLAKGAVLPANKPFLAMVGDQRHGTNVEAPLSTIQEAVALVMEDYAAANLAGHEATVAVLKDILEAVLGIEIGDQVIGQAAQRHNARMAIMRGNV